MTLVFDLDYTLFDTTRFMQDLAHIFKISYQDYLNSSKKYFGEQEHYNAYKHINYLIQEGEISREKNKEIRDELLLLLKKSNEYLFPGVEDLFEKARNQNHVILLVTLGDPVWQGMKINYLKINKYFDRIILTDKEKQKVIDFLKNEKEKIVLVNDNARESLKIKEKIDNINIILIKGPNSKNIKHNLREHELKDVWKEIGYEN